MSEVDVHRYNMLKRRSCEAQRAMADATDERRASKSVTAAYAETGEGGGVARVNGSEHYAEAERLVNEAKQSMDDTPMAAAQVHATLALAAATSHPAERYGSWREKAMKTDATAMPTDPCPECYPRRPDARVRYRCAKHAALQWPHQWRRWDSTGDHGFRCDWCGAVADDPPGGGRCIGPIPPVTS